MSDDGSVNPYESTDYVRPEPHIERVTETPLDWFLYWTAAWLSEHWLRRI